MFRSYYVAAGLVPALYTSDHKGRSYIYKHKKEMIIIYIRIDARKKFKKDGVLEWWSDGVLE